MKTTLVILIAALIAPIAFAQTTQPAAGKPVRVLLLGDSTVMGSVPHVVMPEADQLEDILRKILSGYPDLPPVQVFNKGEDGDMIARMLSRRYDSDVLNLPGGPVDYVFIRYGINDRSYQKDWPATYIASYHSLIARLRKDLPHAVITLETIIPYLDEKTTGPVNDQVRAIAAAENLPLLDTNAIYAAAQKTEPGGLGYNVIPLESVPAHIRPLIPKRAILGDSVYVIDTALRVHLRGLPKYSGDNHPNLNGYQVIGRGLAEYLAPLIRERTAAATTAAATSPQGKN